MTTPAGTLATSDAPAHLVILASAGSGKTHRLTDRYLALLAHDVDPGRILATTFTRLAAGEIRDRIMQRLARAVLEPSAALQLAVATGRNDLKEDGAARLLRTLVANLSRLQLRTLDSFFASVVHAFALPLGLPGSVTLADEPLDERLRRDAIRRMLQREDDEALVESLRVLAEGPADRPVVRTVDAVVRGLASLHRETSPAAWTWMQRVPTLSESDLRAAVALYRRTDPGPSGQHAKAHASDCRRIDVATAGGGEADGGRVEDWVKVLTTGLAGRVVTGEADYYRVPIEAAVREALVPIVAHARAVIWNASVARTAAMHQMLGAFNDAYTAAKHEQGVMTFEDLTSRMIAAQSLASFQEICLRLDARLDHLLLDEFQDTSTQQWTALAPIAQEMVADISDPRSVFCVGDVKQSIYGWRGAAPEILSALPEHLAGPHGGDVVATETLARSRRSAPDVIDAVNTIFGSLGSNAALGKYRGAAEAWSASFEPHATTRDEPGYVELRTSPLPGADLRPADERLLAAADLVADLHGQGHGRRIGVLVRTNSQVAKMLYELGPTRRNVPASAVGGAALTDAAAVGAVLDLLQLADHPADSAAAFNVACSPLGPIVGLVGPTAEGGRGEDGALPRVRAITRHAVAGRVRRALLERGFAATLQTWIAAIAHAADAREQRRLHRLVELAERFDDAPTLRPSEFVTAATALRVEDGGAAPVQVMTVHQSKGLEFEIVVLPDLDRPLVDLAPEKLMIETAESTGAVAHVCAWPPKNSRGLVPELSALATSHEQRLAREALCLLYVAITRARRGLFMLIDPSAKAQPRGTAAGLVRDALAPGPAEPDTVLFGAGDPGWLGAGSEEASTTEPAGGPRQAPDWPAPPVSRVVAPTAHRATVRGALRARDGGAAARGTILHRLAQAVGWIEDFRCDPAGLAEIGRRAAPGCTPARVDAIVTEFLGMLREPAIRSVFERPAGAARLWRERPFAFVGADSDVVHHGAIDRLVGLGDPVDRACVIDFKSDRVEPLFVAERAERHRPQLEVYRTAAARQLGIDRSRVDAAILFLGAGELVRLD